MSHQPDFETFCKLADDADFVPVFRRLISDTLTPVAAFHRLDSGAAACLFESVIGGENVGRYSFLAAEPLMMLEAYAKHIEITHYNPGSENQGMALAEQTEEYESDNPLEELRKKVQAIHVAQVPGLPPFVGGAVGYAGYDTVRYVENLPNAPTDDRKLPDLSFAFYDGMTVFDHVNKTITVLVLADVREGKTQEELAASYKRASEKVDATVERLSQPAAVELEPSDINPKGDVALSFTSNFSQKGYEEAVRNCIEYIHAGDIFQVVISQRLQLPLKVSPFEVYRTLRVVNPSPFMFFLRTPTCTLVGSSPEILVRVVDGTITVRPLAGTRPRGETPEDDQQLADELLADPKERAEHVMLVDLGRNDVGRVAQYGSVQLSDVMEIERYSHVMHITSNVQGKLTEENDAFDALAACLPAGTVSGAPKVRAMEIIDEFEPNRRGPYAGAVGYLDFNGNMDTCIALRTIVVAEGIAYVQAGAGIVAESIPEKEYEETLNKAKGLLKAIEITQDRLLG